MVSCKQCGSHNSLDSTFCKKCGTVVAEIDVQEARAKLEVLVAQGNTAFQDGRTDEAMAISESVLQSDPNSTSALWLKAICHERRNEIGLALECADQIVELNPDSDLDKIRRNQLRNKLSSTLVVNERPDRRIALVGAVAAMVLVACGGVLAASMMKNRGPQADLISTEGNGQTQYLANNTPQVQNPNQTQTNPVSQPQNQQNGVVNPGMTTGPGIGDVPPIRQNTGSQLRDDVQLPPSGNIGGTLPRASESGDNAIRPIKINELPDTRPDTGSTPPSGGNQNDPDDTFRVDPGAQLVAQNNPGTIEIDVYNNGSKNTAKPTDDGGRNGVEAQTRTAYQAYQLGNYSQAANLFEQAIRSGGDPVSLNQRLGQAYERLGRTGDAITAYRRAVQAGEAAISQNKANPSAIRSIVESSQQALKKLGG